MECLGARNLAAIAVFCCPTWSSRRLTPTTKQSITSKRYRLYQVQASSAGSESCVVVKEGERFADEEDYIKAGGSELLFVRMQQNKAMEKQSKLADKVNLHFLS